MDKTLVEPADTSCLDHFIQAVKIQKKNSAKSVIAIKTVKNTILIASILLLSACASSRLPIPTSDIAVPPPIPDIDVAAVPEKSKADKPMVTSDIQLLKKPETEQKAELAKDPWSRIRSGFALPPINSSIVLHYEKWYAGEPEFIYRMSERAAIYLPYIVEEVEKRGMPTEIALLPAIESAFKSRALSRSNASGLWQFMPATGQYFGLEQNWWYDGRRDVFLATDAALDYLQALYGEFGDWHLALAAYNGGLNRIKKAIRQNRQAKLAVDYEHLKLRRETRHYVPKLLAISHVVADPVKYGLTLASITNAPAIDRINLGSQTDLGQLAKLSGLNEARLFALNPALKRSTTPPKGPHFVIVPADSVNRVRHSLETISASQRLYWHRYTVQPGDVLGRIAQKYRLPLAAIQQANKMANVHIRAGEELLIPVSQAVNPLPEKQKSVLAGDGAQTTHRVIRGDTLWGIAQKYDVYISQLTKWNTLEVNTTLQPGQMIRVYIN